MNWVRKPKAANPPIKYHDKMRKWEKNTWPVNFSWNPQMDKATYHNQIDDGSDDNESVDLMTASHAIWRSRNAWKSKAIDKAKVIVNKIKWGL